MQLCYIPELPKLFRRLPFLILAPIKIIHQLVHILLWLLVWIDLTPEFILVQVSLKLYLVGLYDLISAESAYYSDLGACAAGWKSPRQQSNH